MDVLAGEAGVATPEYLANLRHKFGLDKPVLSPTRSLPQKYRHARPGVFISPQFTGSNAHFGSSRADANLDGNSVRHRLGDWYIPGRTRRTLG